jgi:hypothetical protein
VRAWLRGWYVRITLRGYHLRRSTLRISAIVGCVVAEVTTMNSLDITNRSLGQIAIFR